MTTKRQKTSRTVSLSSRITGAVLLVLLPVIGAWVVLEGRSHEAEVPVPEATPPVAGNLIPDSLLPLVAADAPYRVSGPVEHYDTETVYEKINGAAPEYLALGFRELMTLSYAPKDPERFGCEVFLYDMASGENARKIFQQQRGEKVEDVAVGEAGYRVDATWYFHQGPYYVNVLNADEGEAAEAFSEGLAKGLAGRIGAAARR